MQLIPREHLYRWRNNNFDYCWWLSNMWLCIKCICSFVTSIFHMWKYSAIEVCTELPAMFTLHTKILSRWPDADADLVWLTCVGCWFYVLIASATVGASSTWRTSKKKKQSRWLILIYRTPRWLHARTPWQQTSFDATCHSMMQAVADLCIINGFMPIFGATNQCRYDFYSSPHAFKITTPIYYVI